MIMYAFSTLAQIEAPIIVVFFYFNDISKRVLEEDGLSSFGGNTKKVHMFVFGLTVLSFGCGAKCNA